MKLLHIPTGLVLFVENNSIFEEEYECVDESDYCLMDGLMMCSDCPACTYHYNKHKEEYIEMKE